jgi:hypothetical protein
VVGGKTPWGNFFGRFYTSGMNTLLPLLLFNSFSSTDSFLQLSLVSK